MSLWLGVNSVADLYCCTCGIVLVFVASGRALVLESRMVYGFIIHFNFSLAVNYLHRHRIS